MAIEPRHSTGTAAPLLRVASLSKTYTQHRPLSREKYHVVALDQVDLTLARENTLALVGESGSGKSTLARCLVRLEEPSSGEIWFAGKNLLLLEGSELREMRRRIQLVFQDPAAALNPRLTAAEIVAEPLVVRRRGTRRERQQRALELMERVGLPREWAGRSPAEFSGGQRQRLAIARALATDPELLILDEAFSALDPSIQAQMVNLLLDLQASQGLAYLFITHDFGLAGELADEVVVMHRGKIVERAPTAQLLRNPQHPHSRELVAAMPVWPAGRPAWDASAPMPGPGD